VFVEVAYADDLADVEDEPAADNGGGGGVL
jgi:hypothetical protein